MSMLQFFKDILHRPEPPTHDRTAKHWGNDTAWSILPDGRLNAHGWGGQMKAGDYVILPKKDGRTTRYRIDSIEYCSDPVDMWFGVLSFAPRKSEGKE